MRSLPSHETAQRGITMNKSGASERMEHVQKYWRYEYDVSDMYMVPLLEEWGVTLAGAAVLDAGCGEGGGLCALNDRGAVCRGFDIDRDRVDVAEAMKGVRPVAFATGNLYDDAVTFMDSRYDLVVLHDVFEHLDDKDRVIRRLAESLTPRGRILITFPPYYSAYGAHQQHLRTPFAKLPFFHLLPFAMSWLLPRLRHEHPHVIDEVTKLARWKMGMRKFEAIARSAGLRLAGKRAYLISPNHIRFGLKPIPAGPVAEIPFVSELLCTGVVYLLDRP